MKRHCYASASWGEAAGAKRIPASAATKAMTAVNVIHSAGDARSPVVSISRVPIAGVKLPKTPRVCFLPSLAT